MLKRFWFKFSALPYNPLNLGCGVTAFDSDAALTLLKERVFSKGQTPTILEATENVDISTLDQNHVIPNMDDPTRRGVWFPKGYEV